MYEYKQFTSENYVYVQRLIQLFLRKPLLPFSDVDSEEHRTPRDTNTKRTFDRVSELEETTNESYIVIRSPEQIERKSTTFSLEPYFMNCKNFP